MEYDPEVSNPSPIEQSAEDDAGHDQKESGPPEAVPAAEEDAARAMYHHPIVASYEPVSPSYVWVGAEDGKDDKVVGRTGSASPTPAVSTSPSYSPRDSFAEKKNLFGKTFYPVAVKTEDGECSPPVSPRIGRTKGERVKRTPSVSPRIGRTKGERSGRSVSDAFTAPEGGLKLKSFSPVRSKTGARDDSVPLEEEPAKRLRGQAKGQAGEA
jgi:hypothetical protein